MYWSCFLILKNGNLWHHILSDKNFTLTVWYNSGHSILESLINAGASGDITNDSYESLTREHILPIIREGDHSDDEDYADPNGSLLSVPGSLDSLNTHYGNVMQCNMTVYLLFMECNHIMPSWYHNIFKLDMYRILGENIYCQCYYNTRPFSDGLILCGNMRLFVMIISLEWADGHVVITVWDNYVIARYYWHACPCRWWHCRWWSCGYCLTKFCYCHPVCEPPIWCSSWYWINQSAKSSKGKLQVWKSKWSGNFLFYSCLETWWYNGHSL